MSTLKYLEISSTRRNRNLWPYPGEFEVLLSQSGSKGQLNAVDPVCLSAPVKEWSGSFRYTTLSDFVMFTSININDSTTDPSIISLNSNVNFLQLEENYYKGAVLTINNGGTGVRRRITDYELLDGNLITTQKALISVSSPYPDNSISLSTATGYIQNPGNPNITGANLFIPNGSDLQNYYNGLIIENTTQTTDTTRKIIEYSNVTHLAVLGDVSTELPSPAPGWSVNDSYNIRVSTELHTQNMQNSDGSFNRIALQFNSPRIEYKNFFVRNIQPTPTANYNENRQIVSYFSEFGNLTAASGVTVTLPLSSSTRDDYYKNYYITVAGGAAGNTQKVISYDGATRVATLEGALSGAGAGIPYQFMTCVLHPVFASALTFNDEFEMLEFSYDNFYPLDYNNGMVDQQQSVCYQVELTNLILPNLLLTSGSKLVFFPYFYVELQNLSSPNANIKGEIYSNNPASTRMIFRCAVDDISDALRSPFIKINGDNMKQIMKFKPNDNLKFSVRLPNGNLFQTIEDDFYSPRPPNPSVQINALFSLRRM